MPFAHPDNNFHDTATALEVINITLWSHLRLQAADLQKKMLCFVSQNHKVFGKEFLEVEYFR